VELVPEVNAVVDAAVVEEGSAALRATRLGTGLKLGYASGAVVDGIVTNMVNTFLFFYVTTVCGLSAALAGTAVAAGLIVDAVGDPLIGSLSDNHRSRWGRRLPFMLAAMPVLVASFIMIFSLPDWSNKAALFALLCALSISVRLSLSVFNLPYLAVGAELSDNYAERSLIMTWRWGLGMTGALIGVGCAFGIFFKGANGLAQRDAYTPFAAALSAVILGAAAWSASTVWRTRGRQHGPPVASDHAGWSFIRELLELLRNRSFRILFFGALLFFTSLGMTQALGLHTNTFFWHLSSSQAQLITMAFLIGTLIGAPFSGLLVSRVEKKTAVLIGLCGWIVTQVAPTSLRLLGLLPLQGQSLTLLLCGNTLVGGVLMSVGGIAFMSMMADAADEHEYLFGSRREGLFFAGWAFAGKTAGSIGTFLAGLLLTAISFPVEQTKQNGLNVALPERMINELGFFYGPGTSLLLIVGVLLILRYRLDRTAHAAILAKLHQRRASAATIKGHAQ